MKNAFILAITLGLLVPALSRGAQQDGIPHVKRLYLQGDWAAIVKQFPDSTQLAPELEYYRGMALAKLGRLNEAKRAFLEGQAKDPRNAKFSVELAGIAFKQKNYGEARSRLFRALKLNPKDAYAREFLATLFLLDDNLDAAVKNWNRIGEPHIQNVIVDPPVNLDPGLLSRAIEVSPASTLWFKNLRETRAQLNQLGIFPRYRFELVPDRKQKKADDFNLQFSALELNGWGGGKWQDLIPFLRGLPYETVYPEYLNFHHQAINVTSMFRWDDQKRRVMLDYSSPLHGSAKWRYRIYFDGRNENWNITNTFHGPGSPLADLNMRKGEAGAEITSVESGRWRWRMGAVITRRTFRNFTNASQANLPEFANATSLEYRAGTHYILMDRPEGRFILNSSTSAQIGRMFGRSSGTYRRVEGTLSAVWYPQARGERYRISEVVHLGAEGGDVPFDEMFTLGLERDNNLPLRAHVGTLNGRKGNAPLGRRYFLSNWEVDRRIYSNGWIDLTLAPFLDTGRITDDTGLFGEPEWLWDAGGEFKVRVLGGATIILTFGKNLRTGQNAFYTAVPR